MKIRNDRTVLTVLTAAMIFALALTMGCATAAENSPDKPAAQNSANVEAEAAKASDANSNDAKSSDSLPTAPIAESESSTAAGSLATPTETYRTGYAARQNKDLAGLKRVLSKEALEFLTDVGKAENKTLDDMLRDLAARPQAPTAQTRNEKINGNSATLEYLNEKGEWARMDLVKEGNEWKIGFPKGE